MKITALASVLIALLFTASPVAAQATTGHTHQNAPGTRAHDDGNAAYRGGMFREAHLKFRQSALWADKLSQFNLGVMHYHGEGVPADPATAWAWFELSAERGYPQMVEAAAAVWAELDGAGRERAKAVHAALLPRYGDAVALERTAAVMQREWLHRTGTRVGADVGMRVSSRDMPIGMSESGHEFYAQERWDIHQIVAIESRIFDNLAAGRVNVGELETVPERPEPDSSEP